MAAKHFNDPFYEHIIHKREELNGTGLFHPYWLQFEPPPFWGNTGLGLLVGLVGLLSVIGNGLVIFTFLKSPSLRSQKFFIINMALSDALSPLLTYHMFTISSFEGIWSFSIHTCYFYALVQGLCGIVSIVSLAAVATERHLAIVNPRMYKDVGLKKKFLCALLIWAYSFVVVCPPLFGLGHYVAGGYLTTCCFDYIDRSDRTRGFIMHMFFFGLVIPMIVIAYNFYKIWSLVKTNASRRTKAEIEAAEAFRPSETNEAILLEKLSSVQQKVAAVVRGKDLRTAKLVLLVIGVFVAAWTPYAFITMIGQLAPEGSVTPLMAMLPSVFAKASTLYNPILYVFKDNRFRRALRKHVCVAGADEVVHTDSVTTQTQNEQARIQIIV